MASAQYETIIPYNRPLHPSKGGPTGLVLNFSPLEFDDTEVDAGVYSYGPSGKELLKKLRKEHWATHVFRRDGPDEIVAVPVKADAPKLGTKVRKIRLRENLGLTASLIRNALINYLADLPRPVLAYEPIRSFPKRTFWSPAFQRALIVPYGSVCALCTNMAIRPLFLLQTRSVHRSRFRCAHDTHLGPHCRGTHQ